MTAQRRWKSTRALCTCFRAQASFTKCLCILAPLSLLFAANTEWRVNAWRDSVLKPLHAAADRRAQQGLAILDGLPAQPTEEQYLAPPAVTPTRLVVHANTSQALRSKPRASSVDETKVTEQVMVAATTQGAAVAKTVWIFCASQWQECWCPGTAVRWGTSERWHEIKPAHEGQELRVKCSVDRLPDVLPGDGGKHCECAVQPGSAVYKSLNPALLPRSGDARASIATSCDSIRAGERDGPWGAALWEASEAFCHPAWAETPRGTKAGPRALDKKTLNELMLTWVDPRFTGNYARFYDSSGWAQRGFVNYYAGPPEGKHTKMTEELVKSVHAFSSQPIMVVHFGFSTPTSWTAERFPQLVLFHAAPIPSNAGRSFNFNKFRAMLLSRVRVGVELDSDQFVAPGVDAIFPRTEQEVTKEYPMPILPVHFLDRGPKDLGAYWARFCPKDKCIWQTARWGHAHPTWTFWALPFLGRWLRRNFRDEWLPVREGGSMSALRVVSIPEDEDLLNVGTWEEGGTKQWCKLDLPDPGDFEALFNARPGSRDCRHGSCGDIGGDKRFHPRGAAKAFYTAHHAVNPEETKRYVERLKDRHRDRALPPPILYHGRFYTSGQDLRQSNPDATCLI